MACQYRFNPLTGTFELVVGGVSLGSGEGAVFKDEVGGNLRFRSIKSGNNVTITEDGEEITINSIDTGENNTASNVGIGVGIFKQKVGIDLEFKSITSMGRIAITDNGDEVLITTDAELNTASNVGSGIGVFKQKVGEDLEFRGVNGSGRISSSLSGDDVLIETTAEANTAINVGIGQGVFKQKVGEDLELKSIDGMGRISVDGSGDTLEIETTAELNTASNLGAGEGNVFAQKNGEDLELRSIKAGANVTITQSADEILIEAADDKTSVVNIGNGEGEVYKDEVSHEIQLRTIKQGDDIVITQSSDEIEISARQKGFVMQQLNGNISTNVEFDDSPTQAFSLTVPNDGTYILGSDILWNITDDDEAFIWEIRLNGSRITRKREIGIVDDDFIETISLNRVLPNLSQGDVVTFKFGPDDDDEIARVYKNSQIHLREL